MVEYSYIQRQDGTAWFTVEIQDLHKGDHILIHKPDKSFILAECTSDATMVDGEWTVELEYSPGWVYDIEI